MDSQTKNRLIRTAILSCLAAVIGVIIGFVYLSDAREGGPNVSVQTKAPRTINGGVSGIQIGGAFTLLDHNGNAVSEEILAGRHSLIYFGFTYCPAICPTELQKMTQTLEALGEIGAQIDPYFITIDPERDTPDVMKDYIALFHPRFTGLTGTPEQIKDVLKKYRIFATKVDDELSGEYTMDHSSFVYFMDPAGQLLSLYRIADDAEYMSDDINSKIKL